jgi:hypothetical protein
MGTPAAMALEHKPHAGRGADALPSAAGPQLAAGRAARPARAPGAPTPALLGGPARGARRRDPAG